MKEFDIINKLLRPLAGKDSQSFANDCASFEGFSVTKDVLVEGVHFLKRDDSFNLARKCLRVNLSDLAACGAKPFGFLMGISLPLATSETWLKKFTQGLKADIEEFNFQMLGGDTTFHDGPLMISVTAIGKTKNPIGRNGAKPGDNIFVSGPVGKGYLGLQAKLAGKKSKFYELPEPRVELGLKLRKIASACIDISDGLLKDLWHICEESKVGAELYSDQIPLADKKTNIIKLLSGGDDYELLFTSKQKNVKNCIRIGKILTKCTLKLDSKEVSPLGYEHRNAIRKKKG